MPHHPSRRLQQLKYCKILCHIFANWVRHLFNLVMDLNSDYDCQNFS
jgi:hypothetical protein